MYGMFPSYRHVEKDMKHIKLYFKDFKGKKPENFSIGDAAQE